MRKKISLIIMLFSLVSFLLTGCFYGSNDHNEEVVTPVSTLTGNVEVAQTHVEPFTVILLDSSDKVVEVEKANTDTGAFSFDEIEVGDYTLRVEKEIDAEGTGSYGYNDFGLYYIKEQAVTIEEEDTVASNISVEPKFVIEDLEIIPSSDLILGRVTNNTDVEYNNANIRATIKDEQVSNDINGGDFFANANRVNWQITVNSSNLSNWTADDVSPYFKITASNLDVSFQEDSNASNFLTK
ncbi:MAG: hypothetical protein ACOCQR_01165 [bacterium]